MLRWGSIAVTGPGYAALMAPVTTPSDRVEFKVVSQFEAAGDQPAAIDALAMGVDRGDPFQTLLGITGSGKSATIAWTIERVQRPTLVLAPNKSLAAQLANELKEFFPNNRVEYFVSYYDYYQPEAYMPSSDTYIEKDSSVNDEIDRLRHSATSALLTRRDTIVVASVSAIYGLGSPEEYETQLLVLRKGEEHDQRSILRRLVDLQYERNDMNLVRGKFRVRGDTIEIHPAYDETAVRVEMFGDEVEQITVVDPLTGERLDTLEDLVVFPATHYATSAERMQKAVARIEAELSDRLAQFEKDGKLLEAQRLRMRTEYDLEMMQELGYCNGIENYSAPIDGRSAGEAPYTLLDYFPDDFLMVIDESHVAVPQLHGQYEGDRSRKTTLIDHGFRLPSAADNRPLRFDEVMSRLNQVVFLSATPGAYEIDVSAQVVEQIVRPTGTGRSRGGGKAHQGPDRRSACVDQRPRCSQPAGSGHHTHQEDGRRSHRLPTRIGLAGSLSAQRGRHGAAHRDPARSTPRRVRCARRYQSVREGLDLPEVSLVAILDADKEGFLRSDTSLIQMIGRAARNVDGQVVMFADQVTASMQRAISETMRRRGLQQAYNEANGIDPTTVRKAVTDILSLIRPNRGGAVPENASDLAERRRAAENLGDLPDAELERLIFTLEEEMRDAAADLRFEYAARLRDEVKELRRELREMR